MTASAWSWSDVEWGPATPPLWTRADIGPRQGAPKRRTVVHAGSNRPHGPLSRFVGTGAHADRASAALPANHPAVVEGRTLFPSRVIRADRAPRVLVSGINSAKIGKRIIKGPWRGLQVFTLTLEERATCPTSCELLRECFGNAMHLARRVIPGRELEQALERELHAHTAAHPAGIAVRLHVLGDFYSIGYVQFWARMMDELPGLHVFGFTAHRRDTEIGQVISLANAYFDGRWAIRFSVGPDAPVEPGQATTIWRKPTTSIVPEGIVCPAQTHKTDACGSCGLCWSPAAWGKRIAFIGHGLRRTGRGAGA